MGGDLVPSGDDLDRIVVVGSSLAGLRACETLRHEGFRGSVTLIGAEAHRPYDRPPLSKQLLAGDWEPARVALRRPDELDELGLDLRLGLPAAALDVDGRAVVLADGTSIPYDGLVIATGSKARRLPGVGDGVITLRTLDDALALRPRLVPDARVVIVGAGFIGLEVAATARRRGCSVVVLDVAQAPLMRAAGAVIGAALASVHEPEGVNIRCSVVIESIDAQGVTLGAGGERLCADVVVLGVGAEPDTGWLDGSGLELLGGVLCDEALRAGPPGVVAAGDVVRWPVPFWPVPVRLEHWTNAAEQGAASARSLLSGADAEPYRPVPFVWSEQYGHRMQALGYPHPDDEAIVAVGSVEAGRFVALFGRDGMLSGVVGLDLPRPVMRFRAPLSAGMPWGDACALAATLQHELA